MDTYEAWAKALKNTEIIRPRVHKLLTSADTLLPYILLSESTVNIGDTVVRRGEVGLGRPALILPPHIPQFEGFEFENLSDKAENSVVNFLLVRGIQMPSMRYDNHTSSLDIYEGKLTAAIAYYKNFLQQAENVHTGLIAGPEDCWQFSLLIYICSQVVRNAEQDIRHLLEEFRKGER